MIRVLVVEDSPSVRDLLVRILQSDRQFTVVGTAQDGEQAVTLAAQLRPDVITMDLHLPRMDGAAATRRIMAASPTPIVIVTASSDPKGQGLAFEALQAGALTVLDKPPGPGHSLHAAAIEELLTTLRLMAEVKVVRRWIDTQSGPQAGASPAAAGPVRNQTVRPQIVALAASTGGPQAIQTVLAGLGSHINVPVLVVQHMSKGFLDGMVSWLASTCPQPVQLAEHGQEPMCGTIYLAPEDHHLLVTRRGRLALSKAPAVRGFRPSADVLFESVAEAYGPRAVGVILTGMGDDGTAGLVALRATGASTIAQDEATSVIYGMPRAAAASGAIVRTLPLANIGPLLRKLTMSGSPPAQEPPVQGGRH